VVNLQADFESEGQARFVVLGLGSAARVLKPAELRNWVKSEISAMARNAVDS
jgi:predicted DNA-binding transcriptional regulator YafY